MNSDPTSRKQPIAKDETYNARLAHITQIRQELVNHSLASWNRMIEQWSSDTQRDALWIMHAANYLIRTNGVRWAIDPLRLGQRLSEAPEPNLSDLNLLNFVLLTHAHDDHVDPQIWLALCDAPTRWVVPSFMLEKFLKATGRTQQQWGCRLIVPTPLHPLVLDGMRITPFDGMHWEYEVGAAADSVPIGGVPAMGYLVETADRRWLFPGDTRTYVRSRLPDFGPVDIVFAHVWLGRVSALLAKPPQLEAFGRFFAELAPREQIILAHLYETSRTPQDCWVDVHIKQAAAELHRHLPDIQIHAPAFWECVSI